MLPITPELKYILDAIRIQSDTITVLSTGAIGFIILTWFRSHGLLQDNLKVSGFRWSWILISALMGFVGSTIVGYLISSYTTGFYYEIVTGINATNGTKIGNALEYFRKDAYGTYQILTMTHIGLFILSLLAISTWFILNVIFEKGEASA